MNTLVRFGISLDQHLLEEFDQLIARKQYPTRSEAIRDLIRDHLVSQEWAGNQEAVGTLTIVYHHHVHDLLEKLTEIQHRHHRLVLSSMHVHLDENSCVEVLVLRGKAADIQRVADTLISTRGVKHGKLTMTTTAKALT